MNKSSTDINIAKFWVWLEENDELIRKVLRVDSEEKKKELINLFDHKILDFGFFTWEIAEGELKQYALTISPNRDIELLKLSKSIVEKAPEMTHWEFNYAKARANNLEPFKIYDLNHDPHIINANLWTFKLEKDIFYIFAPNLSVLDTESENHVLDLVTTAVLGEEFRILNLTAINRVKEDQDSYRSMQDFSK